MVLSKSKKDKSTLILGWFFLIMSQLCWWVFPRFCSIDTSKYVLDFLGFYFLILAVVAERSYKKEKYKPKPLLEIQATQEKKICVICEDFTMQSVVTRIEDGLVRGQTIKCNSCGFVLLDTDTTYKTS